MAGIQSTDITEIEIETVKYRPASSYIEKDNERIFFGTPKRVYGTCKVKGELCKFVLGVIFTHSKMKTAGDILVAIKNRESGETIGRYGTDCPTYWPHIERFVPREEWPREVFAGKQYKGHDTPDERLRSIIDSIISKAWWPSITKATETRWATDSIAEGVAPFGYDVVRVRSGECTLDDDASGVWVRADFENNFGRTYQAVGLGTKDRGIIYWFNSDTPESKAFELTRALG